LLQRVQAIIFLRFKEHEFKLFHTALNLLIRLTWNQK